MTNLVWQKREFRKVPYFDQNLERISTEANSVLNNRVLRLFTDDFSIKSCRRTAIFVKISQEIPLFDKNLKNGFLQIPLFGLIFQKFLSPYLEWPLYLEI